MVVFVGLVFIFVEKMNLLVFFKVEMDEVLFGGFGFQGFEWIIIFTFEVGIFFEDRLDVQVLFLFFVFVWKF